jgi:hypothetical protein
MTGAETGIFTEIDRRPEYAIRGFGRGFPAHAMYLVDGSELRAGVRHCSPDG